MFRVIITNDEMSEPEAILDYPEIKVIIDGEVIYDELVDESPNTFNHNGVTVIYPEGLIDEGELKAYANTFRYGGLRLFAEEKQEDGEWEITTEDYSTIKHDIEYARELAYELFDGDFTVEVDAYGEEEE